MQLQSYRPQPQPITAGLEAKIHVVLRDKTLAYQGQTITLTQGTHVTYQPKTKEISFSKPIAVTPHAAPVMRMDLHKMYFQTQDKIDTLGRLYIGSMPITPLLFLQDIGQQNAQRIIQQCILAYWRPSSYFLTRPGPSGRQIAGYQDPLQLITTPGALCIQKMMDTLYVKSPELRHFSNMSPQWIDWQQSNQLKISWQNTFGKTPSTNPMLSTQYTLQSLQKSQTPIWDLQHSYLAQHQDRRFMISLSCHNDQAQSILPKPTLGYPHRQPPPVPAEHLLLTPLFFHALQDHLNTLERESHFQGQITLQTNQQIPLSTFSKSLPALNLHLQGQQLNIQTLQISSQPWWKRLWQRLMAWLQGQPIKPPSAQRTIRFRPQSPLQLQWATHQPARWQRMLNPIIKQITLQSDAQVHQWEIQMGISLFQRTLPLFAWTVRNQQQHLVAYSLQKFLQHMMQSDCYHHMQTLRQQILSTIDINQSEVAWPTILPNLSNQQPIYRGLFQMYASEKGQHFELNTQRMPSASDTYLQKDQQGHFRMTIQPESFQPEGHR